MSNLDDFFKKRDKKKKQNTKSKFLTLDTDEFAKQLEATTNLEEEENELNQADQAERQTNQPSSNDNLDEEWKPFDSDENKDYSGLRINIKNWKVEDEENENSGSVDDAEKKTFCPWKSLPSQNKQDEQKSQESSTIETNVKPTTLTDSTNQKSEETQSLKTETDTVSTSTPTAAPSSSGSYIPPALRRLQEKSTNLETSKTSTTEAPTKYIPPSMRNKSNDSSGALTSNQPSNISRKSNKSQPNINDNLEFPTLDATAEISTDKLTNGAAEKFDFPKKAARIEQKSGNANMIDLENKFTALSSNN